MRPGHIIQLDATVVELLPKGACRVELKNGHRLVAFAGRRARPWADELACGDRVTVEVTLYDFSSGRLQSKLNQLEQVTL